MVQTLRSVDISFLFMSEMEVKQQYRYVRSSQCINDMSNFAESDLILESWKNVPSTLCALHNIMEADIALLH